MSLLGRDCHHLKRDSFTNDSSRARKTHVFMNWTHLAGYKIKTIMDHHCTFEAALKTTGSKAMFVLH